MGTRTLKIAAEQRGKIVVLERGMAALVFGPEEMEVILPKPDDGDEAEPMEPHVLAAFLCSELMDYPDLIKELQRRTKEKMDLVEASKETLQ